MTRGGKGKQEGEERGGLEQELKGGKEDWGEDKRGRGKGMTRGGRGGRKEGREERGGTGRGMGDNGFSADLKYLVFFFLASFDLLA